MHTTTYLRTRTITRAAFYTACAAVPVALTVLAAHVGTLITR